MQPEELQKILSEVQKTKAETQTLEIKAAHLGCPEKLYDSLSSFSNQDDGGIILFGVDEKNDFAMVGVYDAQDLQTKVAAQCKNMEPPVRPLFTVCEQAGLTFVSAEIPGLELSLRPCFYSGKGRLKGAYVRVGDADEPMTEYEVYSYEAFRKRYEDDIRPVERATMTAIDQTALEKYLLERKQERPNLASLDSEQINELLSITREGKLTLFAVLLFGLYPQAYFPQLSILATVVEGTAVGDLGA